MTAPQLLTEQLKMSARAVASDLIDEMRKRTPLRAAWDMLPASRQSKLLASWVDTITNAMIGAVRLHDE